MSTGTPRMVPHVLTAPWYLQCLQEAEGAQAPATGHDAEGGVVQQLLVVKPGGGRGVRRGLSTIRSPAMRHSAQPAPKSLSPKLRRVLAPLWGGCGQCIPLAMKAPSVQLQGEAFTVHCDRTGKSNIDVWVGQTLSVPAHKEDGSWVGWGRLRGQSNVGYALTPRGRSPGPGCGEDVGSAVATFRLGQLIGWL